MSQIPYHNAGSNTVYVGGKRIEPGETRHVDAALVPRQPVAAVEPLAPAPEPPPAFDPAVILGGTVAEARAAITARDAQGPVISDDLLHELTAFEAANANRRTLLEAIETERLARAAALAEGES